MGYIIIAILFFLLGIKYGELRDVMLARRITRLIRSSEKIASDHESFESLVKIEKQIKAKNELDLKQKNELDLGKDVV